MLDSCGSMPIVDTHDEKGRIKLMSTDQQYEILVLRNEYEGSKTTEPHRRVRLSRAVILKVRPFY